jgi:hypothetical protein
MPLTGSNRNQAAETNSQTYFSANSRNVWKTRGVSKCNVQFWMNNYSVCWRKYINVGKISNQQTNYTEYEHNRRWRYILTVPEARIKDVSFFPPGVGLVPKRGYQLTLAYYAFPRWYEFGERRWNDMTGENRRTRRKTCPSATLSTTNPTWIDPGSNPGLRGERPATNDLSHGTA